MTAIVPSDSFLINSLQHFVAPTVPRDLDVLYTKIEHSGRQRFSCTATWTVSFLLGQHITIYI